MSVIQLTLPDSLRELVEEQAVMLGPKTAADYLCDLIRKEQRRVVLAKLEGPLLEGLNSGPPIEVTDEFWKDLRRRARERHSVNQSNSL